MSINWKPLVTAKRQHIGVQVRFAIRPQHNSQGQRLIISVRPDILKKAGLSPDDPVRLYHGKNAKGTELGRLVLESGPGSSRLRQKQGARGLVEFSNFGAIEEAWTANSTNMTDLSFVSVDKDGIVFEMPTWEDA